MKRLLVALTLLSSISVRAQMDNDTTHGIFMKPTVLEFSLGPGQTETRTIFVRNQMLKTQQFKIYLNDWQRDSTGGHRYYPPSTLPVSCSRWITLDKEFLEVKPGETGSFNAKLHIPDSAECVKNMKWSMLFVESVSEKVAPNPIGVNATFYQVMRVGIHVLQTPPEVTEKAVKMLSFNKVEVSKDTIGYEIVCKNTGQVQLKCSSFLELINVNSGEKITLDPVDFPLFPDAKRVIDFLLPKSIPKGKYNITAAIDAGDDMPLEAAQSTIDIN